MEGKNMVNGANFYEAAQGWTHPPLTDHDKEILSFGKNFYRNPAERENAVVEKFGHDSTVYFRKLHRLLSHPEARAFAPDVVSRAERIIELSKQQRRSR